MSLKALLAVCLSALISLKSAECANWALLIAGSSGYDNYRHQADICHAYHVLRNHGFPPENIVTMMYDDIAHNAENPFKGNIINQPDGPNVYPGVVIDYRQHDVSPEVFLAVLRGDKDAVKQLTGKDGKVIDSTKNDHVFVNFADHGGPGVLGFPSTILQASDLEKTLKKMHMEKRYNKLVLYVEACESGSMFAYKLPRDISIYASTASNPEQSSYACYYDKKRETYLGDVYSVNWMQDSDKENLETETLATQFKITKEETNTSHVSQYGDLSIKEMVVAEFQGDDKVSGFLPRRPVYATPPHPTEDAVAAPDVALKVLEHKYEAAETLEKKQKAAQAISDLLAHYTTIDQLFEGMVEWLKNSELRNPKVVKENVMRFHGELSFEDLQAERQPITRWDCYEQAVNTLSFSCKNLKLHQNYYALRRLHVLVNLCERGYPDFEIRTAILAASYEHRSLCGSANL